MLQGFRQHRYFAVSLSFLTGLSLFLVACIGERLRRAQPAVAVAPHREAPVDLESKFVTIPEDPVRARQLTAQVELAERVPEENSYIIGNIQRAMRGIGQAAPLSSWIWAEAAAVRGVEFVSIVAGTSPSRQTLLPFAANWSEQMGASMAHVTAALSASVGADLAVSLDRSSTADEKASESSAANGPTPRVSDSTIVTPSASTLLSPASGPGSAGINIAALPKQDGATSVGTDPSTAAGVAAALAAIEEQELNKIAARSKWSRDDLELIFQDTIDVARADDPEATAKENSSYALCMVAALAERGSFVAYKNARDLAFDALEGDGTRGRCTATALAAGSDHVDARSSIGKWTKRQLAWMTKRCARDAARAYGSSPDSEIKSCECLHSRLSRRFDFGELMQMDEQGFARLVESDAQLEACLSAETRPSGAPRDMSKECPGNFTNF